MKRAILVTMLAFLLAACSPPPPQAVTATPDMEMASATPEPVLPTPTRRPLPPTWTPAAGPPQGAGPTTTFVPVTPLPTPTARTECLEFQADYQRTGDTFTLGTSPTIYWTAITGASYRVEILDPQGIVVHVGIAPAGSNSYSVPAEVFQVDERLFAAGTVAVYTWRLLALDTAGNQMCQTPSGELIPLPIPTEGGG